MSGHTPEPWECHEVYGEASAPSTRDEPLCFCGTSPTAGPRSISPAEGIANAKRIVACVNACAGINPEAVLDLLEAVRLAALNYKRTNHSNPELIFDDDHEAWMALNAALAKAEQT